MSRILISTLIICLGTTLGYANTVNKSQALPKNDKASQKVSPAKTKATNTKAKQQAKKDLKDIPTIAHSELQKSKETPNSEANIPEISQNKGFEIPQAKEMEVPTKGYEGNVKVVDLLHALAHVAGLNYISPNMVLGYDKEGRPVRSPLADEMIEFSLGETDALTAFHLVAQNRGYKVNQTEGITYLTHPELKGYDTYEIETYVIRNLDARWMLEPVAAILGIKLQEEVKDENPAYPKSKEKGDNNNSEGSGSGSSGGGSSSGSGSGENENDFETGAMNARYMPALPLAQPLYVGGYKQHTSIFVNRANNSLVVKATPEEHRQVRKFIAQNDIQEAQIQIDLKFVEIEMDDRVKEGVDWTNTLGNAQFSMTPVTMNPANVTQALSNMWVIDPNAVIMGYPTAQATLRFLQTQKNAVLSSAPKVVTKSGVPAAIEATVAESIEVYTIVNTTGVSQPVTSGTEQFKTGVFMDVIATLTPAGKIQLNMNPTVSNKIGETTGSSGQILPIISKRKATTSVTIAPSQTVVIGGLVQAGETGDDNKVPILGDIPILGYFFKSSDTQRRKTSLLIFVTATIVPATYDVPPTQQENELLAREQKLQKRVDYKSRHDKSYGVVEEYTQHMEEKIGVHSPEQRKDYDTSDLPQIPNAEASKPGLEDVETPTVKDNRVDTTHPDPVIVESVALKKAKETKAVTTPTKGGATPASTNKASTAVQPKKENTKEAKPAEQKKEDVVVTPLGKIEPSKNAQPNNVSTSNSK